MFSILKQQLLSPVCAACGSFQSREHLLCEECYLFWIVTNESVQKTTNETEFTYALSWSLHNQHVFSQLIYLMKQGRCRSALKFYTKKLHEKLIAANVLNGIEVIVPIPAKDQKIDHAYEIASELANLTGLPLRQWLKHNNSEVQEIANLKTELPQKLLKRSARARPNRFCLAQNREVITDEARVVGGRVLLIDDVMTTGETLKACTELLKFLGTPKCAALFYRVKNTETNA